MATELAAGPDPARPHSPLPPLVAAEPEDVADAPPSPPSSPAVPSSQAKRVSFDQLHFHEFPVILGDHPATSSGLPVTLDWGATKSYHVPLIQYEAGLTRRAGMELRMPPEVRRDLLHRTGDGAAAAAPPPEEVRRVAQGIRRIKGQRAHSIAMQEFEGLQVFLESAGRKWRRWRDRCSGGAPTDPAAVWLEQWRQQQRQQRAASSGEPATASSCSKSKLDVQIYSMSLPGDILSTKCADVDSSESTRTSATTTSTIHTVASAPELSGIVIEHAVITASEDVEPSSIFDF